MLVFSPSSCSFFWNELSNFFFMGSMNFFYVLSNNKVNNVANTNTFHPCYLRPKCISLLLFNDFNGLSLLDISSERRHVWFLSVQTLFISFKHFNLLKLIYKLLSQHLTEKFKLSLHFLNFLRVLSTAIAFLNVGL